ncbi:MAG: DUF1697 domain-containing protein [Verrucomicrobiota bacterium]|nr:DUF1697 domain-containing protein [Verrucomicrobiota bacterium]
MARSVAFLRAINVGGRVVTMERLRRTFEQLGLVNVETFIASGNVLFESRRARLRLEAEISSALQKELGFEVAAFVRNEPELRIIAAHQPFPTFDVAAGHTLFVAFVASQPSAEARDLLLHCGSLTDEFHFDGEQLYWLCRTRASDSTFSGPRLEKTLRLRVTVRNVNTIRRLVGKMDDARERKVVSPTS